MFFSLLLVLGERLLAIVCGGLFVVCCLSFDDC